MTFSLSLSLHLASTFNIFFVVWINLHFCCRAYVQSIHSFSSVFAGFKPYVFQLYFAVHIVHYDTLLVKCIFLLCCQLFPASTLSCIHLKSYMSSPRQIMIHLNINISFHSNFIIFIAKCIVGFTNNINLL